ncbi:MAG: cysteine--tRNA ligase [Candidatus Micrarchaeaceae archaeon]
MKLYNTLSRKIEEFVPMHGNKVKMFVCGQTVYDDAHLGHAKVYINFDIMASWLRRSGYDLEYVQNITDVEDKIIARAKERGVSPQSLAKHFEERFMEDMEAINVRKNVDRYMRSSDYIDAVRFQIQLLLDKGYAYELDGDIYYDVLKFKDYTKISGMKLEDLSKHRIEPKEGKRNPYDFALWKAAKEGEPSWDIQLKIGNEIKKFSGRPGWHIEDTAMTYSVFGPQYDIHGGALELLFPHHSNEIAQAEAAFGKKPFVKYWVHVGVLTVNGVKMSKSLKNFITIREVLRKYDAEVLRLFFAMSHYRTEVDFEMQMLESTRKQLNDMYSALSILFNYKAKHNGEGQLLQDVKARYAGFKTAMDSDFNTPEAISHMVAALNSVKAEIKEGSEISAAEKSEILSILLDMGSVFGVLLKESYKRDLPGAAAKLIKDREVLRSKGNYKESDRLRSALEKDYGIVLEDTSNGTIWCYKEFL